MASVGHVRDLPSRSPKGEKQPVPGVDLENDFKPTYEILPTKKKTVADLKKAAKNACDVWFATDLDREGEAIAWHLAQSLGIPSNEAKRVVFNAITKTEIENAFSKPRNIDENRVNAQQARRILDRIVGYQVSPLLWKKVAGGLSAGRVQSVAVRVVVEREREIDAFIPDEYWRIGGLFSVEAGKATELATQYKAWLADAPEEKSRTIKERVAWASDAQCMIAELVDFQGEAFKPDNRQVALTAAKALGFEVDDTQEQHFPKAKGTAQNKVYFVGHVSQAPDYRITSIQTKRTQRKPSAPFITSTLQQAGANRLGFPLQRTMRIAQQLYEGMDIHGREGQTGLITYMRTDSTHLSGEAVTMARDYIQSEWGDAYLPDKPKVYSSSNKSAQEAHEAIRPTDVNITPKRVRNELSEEQFKLYKLIWERFMACQCTPAQWDQTTVNITVDKPNATFRASGRTLVFDGFYKATGIPNNGEDAILPPLTENQQVGPVEIQPTQHFTSPPPRYTEASLQKKLEEEGIGRPSTYAAIIQTVQDRKYVEQVAPRDRRLMATDLGAVVTDKLIQGFPRIMDVAYTREMESELDKIEEEHLDWITMLHQFYDRFKVNLENAHETMTHAKAEMQPAPHKCPTCEGDTVYRFGKNGRFLSCANYPDCKFAAPIDREGNPMQPELSDILCPICDKGMTKRTGRFGPFLGCVDYPECKGIVNLDPKKGFVKLPKTPPLLTDLPCNKCEAPLNMRDSKRGFWLSCSKFPKCRGRTGWKSVEEDKQKELEAAWTKHVAENPVPDIKNTKGVVLGDEYLPIIETDDTDGNENASQE
ncbi:MAG: type I DNA topoisomerase [Phycisphaeraceae bacterium]|nr:type I DNA topoisomerase [Phycisphaeraceae bacterium]